MGNSENQSTHLIVGPGALASVLLASAVLVVGLWFGSGLLGSRAWPIEWLNVEGSIERTSVGQIRAVVDKPAAKGFFGADLERIRRDIEQLPWIAHAEVRRQWPDALHIRVREHRAVARWNEDWLFSESGEVFRVEGSEGMQGLVSLSGPDQLGFEVLETWRSIRQPLRRIGRDIARLEVDERGAWTAQLDSGLVLLLGREHLNRRLWRFVRVHDALLVSQRRAERIDLRYTNGLVVRWQSAPGTGEGDEQHG